MKTLSATIKALTFAVFFFVLSAAAQAQATRTWVSGVGDDINPCSRTAPCKTYAGAQSKTAAHGEISTLDPGGYGAISITKSLTIEGTQGAGYGSILHSLTTGVTINFDNFAAVGETQKTVRLRNLNINGSGGATAANFGLRGIRITGAAAAAGSEVFVEDCVIDGSLGNPGRGIEDVRSGGGRLVVTGTTVRNMAGTGIVVIPASGATRIDATLDNVRVHNCAFGVVASSGVRMLVSNSLISNNTNHGLGVEGPNGAAEMHVTNSRIASNATGIRQDAGGTVRVANSDVVFNTANGTVGTVNSYGNNRFAGNAGASAVVAIGADTHDKGQQ
ncbi:MAG: right-handed parallel beta-helix repeat-containing protein [Acidobacteria bacterium]|nr:right-handed parallel beta-helix repeat-containing protein [Acidobacteriota bacterium]